MLSKPGIEGNFLSLIKGIYEKPGLPRWLSGKESTCQCRRHRETWVRSLGQEDPLEQEMATHSSILAWKIPWTEEPGGLDMTEWLTHTQQGRLPVF